MLGKRASSSHCLDSSRQGDEQPHLTGDSRSGIGTRGANFPSIAQRKLLHNPSQIPSAKSPLGETQRATIPDFYCGSRSKGPLTVCVSQPCNPSPEFEYISKLEQQRKGRSLVGGQLCLDHFVAYGLYDGLHLHHR